MTKFCLSAVAAVFLAQGCIIIDDDDDNGGQRDDLGTFDLAWNLDPGCPAGATTITVYFDDGVEVVSETFDCQAIAEVQSLEYLRGTYDIWVIVDDEELADGFIYAQSDVQTGVVLTGYGTVVPSFDFLTEEGFMRLDWTLVDTGANVLTCAEAGTDAAALVATFIGAGPEVLPLDFEWNCEDGLGITNPMPVDTYDVVVEVLDSEGFSLGASDPETVTINYGNEVVDLETFTFEFD